MPSKNTALRLLVSMLLVGLVSVSLAEHGWNSVQELIQRAEAGDPQAQFQLGSAYDSGTGVPRDGGTAMKWYARAAEAGNAEAQNSVGSGLQAEKQYADALAWYERAAAQGHALATNNLAYLYDLGLGTKQDRQKAFVLYSRAAELGWAEAMWNLANVYGAGQLGEKNLDMACVWSFRAVQFAEPQWRERLKPAFKAIRIFERSFSNERLVACKQKAEAWSPSGGNEQDRSENGISDDAPKAARH